MLEPRGERPVRVLRADRLRAHEAHRAAVEPGGDAHDRDAGLLVAGHDRAFDRGGPAPARQQRRMDVEHQVLGQQRLLDQRPERAHADGLGRGGGDPCAGVLVVDRFGLEDLDPERLRPLGDRRRCQAPSAPARTVGARDDERRAVRGVGQALEHGRGEVGRAQIDGAHAVVPARRQAAACASRSARIASLRWSRLVRSRISTPSRWSISCWITRASSPEASIRIGSPYSSKPRTRTWIAPLDVDEHGRKAEAALLHRLRLAARPFDLRVDERQHGRLLLHPVDEHAVQDADLGGGQPDAERVDHQLAHPRDLRAQRLVEAIDRARPRLEHRIAELPHLGQSGAAPCGDLRIELRLSRPPRGDPPRASSSSSASRSSVVSSSTASV